MVFPGMDPYLENPRLWPSVHSRLVVYIGDFLRPQLEPRYVASVEERVFVEGPDREVIPDVWIGRASGTQRPSAAVMEADTPIVVEVADLEISEPYIEILDTESDMRVVTVIEVVSPSNKAEGAGRAAYRRKQREILSSETHLVEIDLLRTGRHVLAVPEETARRKGDYDYLVAVNRNIGERTQFELYHNSLPDRLPRVRVPLAGDDPDSVIDLQAVTSQTYESGSYRLRVDYSQPCLPPLGRVKQEWADSLAPR